MKHKEKETPNQMGLCWIDWFLGRRELSAEVEGIPSITHEGVSTAWYRGKQPPRYSRNRGLGAPTLSSAACGSWMSRRDKGAGPLYPHIILSLQVGCKLSEARLQQLAIPERNVQLRPGLRQHSRKQLKGKTWQRSSPWCHVLSMHSSIYGHLGCST